MSSGVFGDDIDSAVIYGVDCSGNETSILRCSLSTLGLHSEHSASVICQSNALCYKEKFYNMFIHVGIAVEASNCSDGELRLSGAALTNQGRLEVCVNGAWGSVCDSQGVFTTDEAKVACRQLGMLQVEGL